MSLLDELGGGPSPLGEINMYNNIGSFDLRRKSRELGMDTYNAEGPSNSPAFDANAVVAGA
jgi:hypothetical protein